MESFTFRCIACGSAAEPGPAALRCAACASPFAVDYGPQDPPARSRSGSSLPLTRPESMVTLGEGNTPVIELGRVASDLGIGSLTAKLESSNPTGSFKDRGIAVMLSALAEHGVDGFVEDSSGNAGASAAAYAARAGMTAHVFVPESAPRGKVAQIAVFGARVHRVPGARECARQAAQAYVAETGLAYASHNLSPYFIEGTRSFAYEAVEQWADAPPGHIVLPTGNGSIFIATHLALLELRDSGRIRRLPRLHAVQSSAAMPVVAAQSGLAWTPEPNASTVAGGIASVDPPRMIQILAGLSGTNGVAVAVSDADILRWRARLAEREGVYVEPTSAAAFAGLETLVKSGEIARGDSVLVPVTGSGLKAP